MLTYDRRNKQNLPVVNIVHAEQNINKQIFVDKNKLINYTFTDIELSLGMIDVLFHNCGACCSQTH